MTTKHSTTSGYGSNFHHMICLLRGIRIIIGSLAIGLLAGAACGVLGFFAWMTGFEHATGKIFDKMLEWLEWIEA